MGLELRVGPAGYPWYYLQVHRVLHMLRGSASLSEGSEEEEVSTALRWASERGVSGREDVGKPRPQSSVSQPRIHPERSWLWQPHADPHP